VLVTFSACTKSNINTNTPAASTPFPAAPTPFPAAISIVLHPETPGLTIPNTFQGISLGVETFSNPNYLSPQNTVFLNLIKNLGDQGCFRFRGDVIVYTGEAHPDVNSGKDSLSTTDIDRVSAFLKATHWNAIYGLNLAINSTSLAANEAQYVSNAFGSQLINFQVGNEPNDYNGKARPSSYSYNDYQTEWNNYYTAVKAVLPNAPFSGPDVSANKKGQNFIPNFVAVQNTKVNLLTGHYFMTTTGGVPVTLGSILSTDTALLSYLSIFKTAGNQSNLSYRITETNTTISKEAVSGVSNGFAASLWALDYMWILAEHACQGVNFQGGNGFTSIPNYYYGMLAFKQGAVGNIIPIDITNTSNVNCTVHASFSNNVEYLTIVNKDTANAAAINVTPNRSASSVQVMRLSAPSLNNTTAITFAGSPVNADGTFQVQTTENYALTTPNFIVNVPSGSAAVIQIK